MIDDAELVVICDLIVRYTYKWYTYKYFRPKWVNRVMVNRLPIESRFVVVLLWLGRLLRMDDVCGFVIPTRHTQLLSVVSHGITHHPIIVAQTKKRRLRNVTASQCTPLTSLFSFKSDEWNDEKEVSDESQAPMIVTYNDFDDFALTNGVSPASFSSSSTTTFYNDFDDQTVGVENDDIATSSHCDDDDDDNGRMKTNNKDVMLLSRMSSLQREEQRRLAVCDRNWKLGNWFVRGFSLEEETTYSYPIPSVSTIITSSSVTDNYSDEDDDDDDDDMDMLQKEIDVWVGRTDGSIFGIRFGTDYWTRLGNSDVALDEFESLGMNKDTVFLDRDDHNDDDDDDSGVTLRNEPTDTNPFTIVTQFKCKCSSAITSIVALPAMATTNDDDDDDDTEAMKFDIYAACKDSMIIDHWHYDGNGVSFSNSIITTQSTQNKALSILTLRKIHMMVKEVPTTMILAVNDGSMTLWDIKTDTMIGVINTIQIPDVPGGSGLYDIQTITCIDTDNEFVYVGTESGYVLVYAIHDILQQGCPQSESISAVGCWRAAPTDDCPITAIKCGGPGTLGRNSASTTSSILYTGDAQGLVKQWEVLKMLSNAATSSNDNVSSTNGRKKYKIEAWPKLATQRLPKKAHVFTGHSAAITGLLSVDALKFVSASADGTGMFGYVCKEQIHSQQILCHQTI